MTNAGLGAKCAWRAELRQWRIFLRYSGRVFDKGEGSARLMLIDDECQLREPSPQPSPGVPGEGARLLGHVHAITGLPHNLPPNWPAFPANRKSSSGR